MWRTMLMLVAAGALFGQETPLARLKREATRLRAPAEESKRPHTVQVAGVHAALRAWIESRLPEDKGLLAIRSGSLESSMQAELKDAGLDTPDAGGAADPFEFPAAGHVEMRLEQIPELPNTLFVFAGASVPCGVDEALYVYHFEVTGRRLVIADHPESDWGYTGTEIELSEPDPSGRRLLLTHRYSVQCASTWMGMAYSVYRLPYAAGTVERLLDEQHGFWLGNDGPDFVLKPDELIVEFLDGSIDTGVHNRTRIHRYSFVDSVRRLDPVAMQPQDFVEEWLTRPWSEMESRSSAETRDWHEKLHADAEFGDYDGVIGCMERPGQWLIGLHIDYQDGKELPEPLHRFFIVRQLGQYRYRMESVGEERPRGCFGTEISLEKHPWLSTSELKALR